MTLLTAHKILISSAIAMFVLYAAYELRNYFGGEEAALIRSLASAAGAGGFAVYLRSVFRGFGS